MIEVLLERFLIYNPKSQKDKKKFKDKKINTYLFLLDKNSYIKIEWDWDKALSNEIKPELKEVLKEHFESYHNDIYKYFNHIKNDNMELWDNELNSMHNCPDYIKESLIVIIENIKMRKEFGIDYDICELTNEKLNYYLNKHLDSYFE